MDNPITSEFNTTVTSGENLMKMLQDAEKYEKRDCFAALQKFLSSAAEPRVCVVYGLRRTGKTTMLKQAFLEMSAAEKAKTVYIKADIKNTITDLNKDLRTLQAMGIKNVFIDEVTLIKDFIDSAALLSDIYASMGMKIVLSGKDSLGFWLASNDELYDRTRMIHTTFIPFHEHSRLLKIDSIDEYIRYGGTLLAGETNFADKELLKEEASFRNDESTRRYIDTAISKNIQHSLACCEDGGRFMHLYSLYEAKELTGAINRIIEDMNHRFILEVLTRDFELNGSRNIDKTAACKRLMEILEIRNKEEQAVGITKSHIAEIKEYLRVLDLICYMPVEVMISDAEPYENIVFTQPGMRYCQAQALVYSLMQDKMFSGESEYTKKLVSDRILDEVKGRMLEDIVLLETQKALDSERYKVFKLRFIDGEFDMVIYDREDNNCRIYEVKHSQKAIANQYRHLVDKDKCDLTARRFGTITEKCVLYRGDDLTEDSGIEYRNVEGYLKSLREPYADITQNHGMELNM